MGVRQPLQVVEQTMETFPTMVTASSRNSRSGDDPSSSAEGTQRCSSVADNERASWIHDNGSLFYGVGWSRSEWYERSAYTHDAARSQTIGLAEDPYELLADGKYVAGDIQKAYQDHQEDSAEASEEIANDIAIAREEMLGVCASLREELTALLDEIRNEHRNAIAALRSF